MSKAALQAVVTKWHGDEEFRRMLASYPHAALKDFDLTAEEVAAVVNRDPGKVAYLQVDERLSKGVLSN